MTQKRVSQAMALNVTRSRIDDFIGWCIEFHLLVLNFQFFEIFDPISPLTGHAR
jgi:hypothetical protein